MKQYHYQESCTLPRELKKQFRLFQVERIIYAILMALMGVLFLVLPAESGDALCIIAGIFLITAGVVSVTIYFARSVLFGGISLVFGVLLMLAGILCLSQPGIAQWVLTLLTGLIIIVDGSTMLVNSIECAHVKIKGWGWILLLSLLTMLLGGLVFFGDFTTFMQIAGCALIVDALCKVIVTLVFGNRIHSAHREIHNLRHSFYQANDAIEDVPYEEVKK